MAVDEKREEGDKVAKEAGQQVEIKTMSECIDVNSSKLQERDEGAKKVKNVMLQL